MLREHSRRWQWMAVGMAVALLISLAGAGCRRAAQQVLKEGSAEIQAKARKGAGEEAAVVLRQALEEVERSLPAVERDVLARGLSPVRAQLFQAIDKGLKRPPLISISPRAVKEFISSFGKGERNPARFLRGLEGEENQTLSRDWLATPEERRVFLVGSGHDLMMVKKLRANLESKGFRLFFYKFCKPQCTSEVVGAFRGTARETLLLSTANAAASPFVSQEVSATIRHQEGTRLAFLVATEDLLLAQQLGERTSVKAVPLIIEN